jgi:phosphoglycolate phosphatase-like HAD superfamily hydrolase
MNDRPAVPTRLVLWDVDHTLINTGGVGREAFSAAFSATTGLTQAETVDPSGLTEGDIFRRTATAHGILDPESLFSAFAGHLAQAYESRLDRLRARGRALDGAHDALKFIVERPKVVQGVLTGNLRAVAHLKLAAFGLDEYIDWNISAFAEDGSHRTELVDAARSRAQRSTAGSFRGGRTILIGDTLNDVETALRTSASIIAVATGRFAATQLRAAGANEVVASLDDSTFVGALHALLDLA